MIKRYIKPLLTLGAAAVAFTTAQAAHATTCTAGFNNHSALRALPNWANSTFVIGDSGATPPKAPPLYKEPCSGGKSLWVGEDWLSPKYFHYHLGYENTCMDPINVSLCANGMVPNKCDNYRCVDASLQRRTLGSHWFDHQLRFALQPAPAKWCISRLTGNDVPANDPNAVCAELGGVKMAPVSVKVQSDSIRVYLWWKEKMGVSTPGGIRYTIVSKQAAVDLNKGSRTFSGFTRKYDFFRVSGITTPAILDDFTVDY
jgi:hypothetical protein